MRVNEMAPMTDAELSDFLKTHARFQPTPWTEERDDYLKANFHKQTDEEMTGALNKTPYAIYERRVKLGLFRKHSKGAANITRELVREELKQMISEGTFKSRRQAAHVIAKILTAKGHPMKWRAIWDHIKAIEEGG